MSKPNVTRIANGLIYDFPDEKSRIPPHTHEEVSHYAYVLAGMFSISCAQGELLAKPGDFIDFPIGENHGLQPLGAAVVFNRFHAPCKPSQLGDLIRTDLANLRSETVKKSTQKWLYIGGAAALLYYFFVQKSSAATATLPANMGLNQCQTDSWDT